MVDPQASRFWRAAVRSGLVDDAALRTCWEAIPEDKRTADAVDRRLARQAINAGLVTTWQVQQLLTGHVTGFKIDRYILLELLGQGGMGRVYLAKDTRLGRRVALKVLSKDRMNNPRAIARFQREAKVGAQLQHENLVRIYDEGEASGICYLVMEFIDGKNVGKLIAEQGAIPWPAAVGLARQVALGLEHAQQKGLIHRDVNPFNILVTLDGVAKLADLGLAIDLADQAEVTRDGATVGTFDYVSPEQAKHSRAVDTRSDVYSLGCTLYHMIAGRVPFPAASLPEKLYAHQLHDAEPLTKLVSDVPPGLADIVRKMMRKRPDERFPSPLAVAHALEPYLDETAKLDPAAPPRRVSSIGSGGPKTLVAPAVRADGVPSQAVAAKTAGSLSGASDPDLAFLVIDTGPEIPLTETLSASLKTKPKPKPVVAPETQSTNETPIISRRRPSIGLVAVAAGVVLAVGAGVGLTIFRNPSKQNAAPLVSPSKTKASTHPASIDVAKPAKPKGSSIAVVVGQARREVASLKDAVDIPRAPAEKSSSIRRVRSGSRRPTRFGSRAATSRSEARTEPRRSSSWT